MSQSNSETSTESTHQSEFQKNYFQLFDLSERFALDTKHLGEQFRQLQQQLHPDRYADKMGLFQVEPFRPGQIPVILVHGLMSSPGTWVAALNQLRDDPLLRDRSVQKFDYLRIC